MDRPAHRATANPPLRRGGGGAGAMNPDRLLGEPLRLPDSLWAATAPAAPALPSLDGRHAADVLIIGAGFTGLSAAIRLCREGRRVIVLDAAEPGWGASGRNNGQVIAGLKQDPEVIETLYPGEGVEIGADRYMARLGLDVAVFAAEAARLGDEGKTPLYAAIDGRLAAMIAVADPIKDTTAAAIRALHGLGLKVAMITGDNRRTGEAIARQLGIDEVIAEVLPDGKVDAVKRLKAEHGALAYVGDGINDAPALAEADVGIAIGTGTDIAIEAADVVLMSGDLGGVPNAIALSQATMANIRQNLFWAFAYNVALIPVAAGVLYPVNGSLLSPVFAAGAMALSSVFVLSNALRLRRFAAPFAAR